MSEELKREIPDEIVYQAERILAAEFHPTSGFSNDDPNLNWARGVTAYKAALAPREAQVQALVEAAARVVAHYNIVHGDMPEEMRFFSSGVALIGALEKALIPLDPRPRSSGSEAKVNP